MARLLIGRPYVGDEDAMLIVSESGYVLTNRKESEIKDTLIFDIDGPDIPEDCEFVYLVVDKVKRTCWTQRIN